MVKEHSEKVNAKTIKIEKVKLPQSKMRLTFSVPAEEFEKMSEQTAQELSLKLKFNGFRQGKVPVKVVENTLGGDVFLEEMVERAVRKFYVDGILDENVPVIGRPEVKIKNQGRNQDLVFEAEVSVFPEVKIKDWKESVKKINKDFIVPNKELEVSEKEVQRELDFLAKQRARMALVNRSAQMDDQVEIDFEVFKDGAIVEGGTAKKHLLILGEKNFIPGFEEQLVGLSAGQKKEFKLTFPKKYHSHFLAGQEALFKVKMNSVWERILPEINDEFAKGIGRFKSLEELSNNIKEGIKQEKENEWKGKKQVAILERLIEDCQTELPEVLVVAEAEKMLEELVERLAVMGMTKENYFQQTGMSEEEIKKKWQEKEAANRVKAGLIIAQIAKEEKIQPENSEIEERMNLALRFFKNEKSIRDSQIDLKALYERSKNELINEKVLQYLMDLN